ncbi:MAG: carbamoyl-phosphate synthase large subunit, partial [Actinobacteria bacterium]|nr:carbamoyl-phosphate synthase large subunit [Actinomycetota bacterium]
MPKRSDIKSVLVIGSGPIVIGQACEFDYSGTQACRVLREEGVRVILVNSNPATIMTDPDFADATYVEPITPEVIEAIILKEKPDAILPTLGGQTALNAAMQLHERGILEKYNVELIGAKVEAIKKGEDRQTFKQLVLDAGADVPKSIICSTLEECVSAATEIGYPIMVQPSFTMGGLGSGFAYDEKELRRICSSGLQASPVSQVLLSESILGWKEFELELMRDTNDNCVVVCSIENVDPVGVHTGDSITVAPALTLTDREYQNLRDISIDIIRAVGVDTGGCNIQFAVNPEDGRVVVIEMNPRVSRSSALASKATGFPIAKIAAKLAIGYTLDEIPNDITKKTPASFEPTLDYVVVKVPRFAFEKFPAANKTLGTAMKSVGEAMAIGRNYTQALQKALRSLEKRGSSFHWEGQKPDPKALLKTISIPTDGRIVDVQQALRGGATAKEVFDATKIDPWFIDQMVLINEVAESINAAKQLTEDVFKMAKNHGFSDAQIGQLRGLEEIEVRSLRHGLGLRPSYKTVDTCAGEFPALTPYHYSTYEQETEVSPSERQKVIILGSGPNRIGQGVEFDYSCVHASFALSDAGYETIMINCNPETVSTDYDTSDRLYFEPLTLEDVLEVIHAEQQSGELVGVVVQLGGQTALGLAKGIEAAGITILGTTPDAIDLAEERGLFSKILESAGLRAPANGTALNLKEADEIANQIGYPVLVRPSFVLGGRGMEIVYEPSGLSDYFDRIADQGIVGPSHPLLVDRFLDDAIEIDVDALFDGKELYIGGVMEHIEEAGIHSGDSSCTLPPVTLSDSQIQRVREATHQIAIGVGVKGLLNVQFAIAADVLYVLEANPRASRTVPFVSKALGITLAQAAAMVMVGQSIKELIANGHLPPVDGTYIPAGSPISVKEAVLPFKRFATVDGRFVDSLLGPEMRSTGEVMGIDVDFPKAFAKSQAAAGSALPVSGSIFISVADRDKPLVFLPVRRLLLLGLVVVGWWGCGGFV